MPSIISEWPEWDKQESKRWDQRDIRKPGHAGNFDVDFNFK